MDETVEIRAGDGSTARIALRGAEPVSWQVDGRDYLWNGDPEHWNRSAPWLFPVVGASSSCHVQVEGRRYPMAQHGFARDLPFTLVSRREDAVSLRLSDSEATRAHFPFAFRLTIEARITPNGLAFAIEVENPGEVPLPTPSVSTRPFPGPSPEASGALEAATRFCSRRRSGPSYPRSALAGCWCAASGPCPSMGRASTSIRTCSPRPWSSSTRRAA